ncbi:MAG: PLP-dependent aminotransferase family protein [Christensenellales bacterium]
MTELKDSAQAVPAYIRIYDKIKEGIIKGIYPYATKLPSKRVMASDMGVSTITIEHSYALLCEEGYVESRERSGFFVIFRLTDGFALSSNNHFSHFTHHSAHDSLPEFPFSVLTKTMRRVMNDYGEALLEKSPNSGCLELREAIRQYLARNRGIYADIEQIVIGSGAEYLYSLIVGILGRERSFALESPSYEKIEQVYRSEGIKYQFLPLGSDGIESSALAKTTADVLHISPYRSYPTGITASASKRHEYIRWSGNGDRYIVEDDFESEFSLSGKIEETLFSLSRYNNVIYMNTFTRTISPSLRVGYMVLPKRLVDVFSRKLGFCSCTVPTFEQFVLAELISSGDFERHINRVRRAKRKI